MRMMQVAVLALLPLVAACGKPRAEVKSAAVVEYVREGATQKNVHFAPVAVTAAKELTAFLEGWDTDQKSSMAGAWMESAEIVFTLADGSRITVGISSEFDHWSSGHGDFPVKPGLKDYIETKLPKE